MLMAVKMMWSRKFCGGNILEQIICGGNGLYLLKIFECEASRLIMPPTLLALVMMTRWSLVQQTSATLL